MRVPLVLFLTAVALSGAGLWLWAACGPKNAPPPELYYDFGVIRHGLAKDHVFEVPLPQTVGGEEIIPVTFWGDCACASGTIMTRTPRETGAWWPVWRAPTRGFAAARRCCCR